MYMYVYKLFNSLRGSASYKSLSKGYWGSWTVFTHKDGIHKHCKYVVIL